MMSTSRRHAESATVVRWPPPPEQGHLSRRWLRDWGAPRPTSLARAGSHGLVRRHFDIAPTQLDADDVRTLGVVSQAGLPIARISAQLSGAYFGCLPSGHCAAEQARKAVAK